MASRKESYIGGFLLNDFGFTTEEESTPEGIISVLEAIAPLLYNLYDEDNKQPIIKWPNRADKIDEFIDQLVTVSGIAHEEAKVIFKWARQYRENMG